MRIAILLCGHIRTWEKCKDNFIQTFCQEHEVDIYVHTYNQKYCYHPFIAGKLNISDEKNTQEITQKDLQLFDIINVKKIVLENQENVINGITDIDEYPVNMDIHCQYRKINLCNSLLQEQNTYDLIIKTRMDIKYSTPFILPNAKENTIYISPCDTVYPQDACFIAEPKTFNRFISVLTGKYPQKIINPHLWMQICIQQGFQLESLSSSVEFVRLDKSE